MRSVTSLFLLSVVAVSQYLVSAANLAQNIVLNQTTLQSSILNNNKNNKPLLALPGDPCDILVLLPDDDANFTVSFSNYVEPRRPVDLALRFTDLANENVVARLRRNRARWSDNIPGNRFSYRNAEGRFELLWGTSMLVPYSVVKEVLDTSQIWISAWGEGPQRGVPRADVSFTWNQTILVALGTLT